MSFLAQLARRDLPQIRAANLERTMEVVRPICPHKPSTRQAEFLALDCEEALYGGAAGGGKSDCAVMAALQYVDVPEYSAVLFRRKETDFALPGSVLDLLTKWLAQSGYPARWSKKLHGYVFPSGATIHFGYAQTLAQLSDKYQGSYFQYIGFDELTQWPQTLYTYMFSRLRRLAKTNVPLRMRGYTNPGNRGHQWVKDRFVAYARHITAGSDARADIKGFQTGGVRLPAPAVYVSQPSEEARVLARETGAPAQPAYFVPAFLKDNPGLDHDGYSRNLARMDAVRRGQLSRGDWDVVSDGTFFKASHFRFLKARPDGLRWIRSWDFAATEPEPGKDPDFTAGSLQTIERTDDNSKRLIIGDMQHFQEDPGGTNRRVKETARKDGKKVVVVLEQEPGSAGKQVVHTYKTSTLFGWIVRSYPRTGAKSLYWEMVSVVAEVGHLYLVEGDWNAGVIEELTSLPVGHDDRADCISGGYAYQTGQAGSAADRVRMLTGK